MDLNQIVLRAVDEREYERLFREWFKGKREQPQDRIPAEIAATPCYDSYQSALDDLTRHVLARSVSVNSITAPSREGDRRTWYIYDAKRLDERKRMNIAWLATINLKKAGNVSLDYMFGDDPYEDNRPFFRIELAEVGGLVIPFKITVAPQMYGQVIFDPPLNPYPAQKVKALANLSTTRIRPLTSRVEEERRAIEATLITRRIRLKLISHEEYQSMVRYWNEVPTDSDDFIFAEMETVPVFSDYERLVRMIMAEPHGDEIQFYSRHDQQWKKEYVRRMREGDVSRLVERFETWQDERLSLKLNHKACTFRHEELRALLTFTREGERIFPVRAVIPPGLRPYYDGAMGLQPHGQYILAVLNPANQDGLVSVK